MEIDETANTSCRSMRDETPKGKNKGGRRVSCRDRTERWYLRCYGRNL